MPIHVVPLVVGGTIAVIGTGYAFKKFVYDPHLAPIVDIFLATHHIGSRDLHQSTRLTEPVSVRSTSASFSKSTAIAHDRGALRRRRYRGHADGEEREGLLELEEDNLSWNNGLSASTDFTGDGVAVELRPMFSTTKSSRHPRPMPHRSSSDRPRPQDDEIRSVIFKVEEPKPISDRLGTTGGLVLTSAGSTMLVPDIPIPSPSPPAPATATTAHAAGDPSTTFSFLSLSQASSPEVPHSNLMSFSQLQPSYLDAVSPGGEVVSLPDTGTGYQTDDFSAVSSPRLRSGNVDGSFIRIGNGSGTGAASGLGLNTVGDVGMSYLSPKRGSRSVISLSESEGAGGGSDWEALSEPRSA